ncbi:MAG: DUF3015 family protein [Candidatus Omnitrophica bacterium]|nr:DUF3015 family protein [Candidatus Omnitrophota bacterium]
MKKLLGVMLVATALVVAAGSSAQAQTKDLQEIFEECGLGGMLFPSWPIGASVSNFTWDFGSTASTSGLTTPDACKGGQAKMAAYIYESYDSIEQDLAKGDGKYLDMLALLAEKDASEKEIFVQEVRTQFRDMVAKADYSSLNRLEKAKLVYSIVQSIS